MDANKTKIKQNILATVADLVGDFLYHNREECEDLPTGVIEDMVGSGDMTKQELVNHFSMLLDERLR